MTRLAKQRATVVAAMRKMQGHGLNHGSAGNVSLKVEGGMLVSPTGVAPDELAAEQVVYVSDSGAWNPAGSKPTSEWRMHLGLLQRRPDMPAVVHCRSRHATVLACAGREIPAFHYRIALAGGARIPLAPYATFGTQELAEEIADTLDGFRACLMANHGQIAIGRTLDEALAVAVEVEEQAALYCGTLAIGGPVPLDEREMQRVAAAFLRYGETGEPS